MPNIPTIVRAIPHLRQRLVGPPDTQRAISGALGGVDGLVWGFAVDQLLGYADGDKVYMVPDISGNGYPAVQGLTGWAPIYKVSQVNGLPALSFDGLQQCLELPCIFGSLTAAEMFVVVKAAGDSGINEGLYHFGSATDAENFPYSGDGVVYEQFGTTARKTTVNPTPTLVAWNIYQVASSSGNFTTWLNGTQLFTTATNTVGFSTTEITVGRAHQIAGSAAFIPFTGYIAEIRVYDHALTTGDRTSVKSALGTKYNITVV